MSISYGLGVVTNGLTFYYDMNNTRKSWKGKPLTNYYGDISASQGIRPSRTQHFWTGNDWIVNATYTHPGVAGPIGTFLGLVYKHTSGALNSTWSGNSYGYTLKDISSTSTNTYTMSVWTYVSSDCNIDALPCTTEGASTNNIAVSGYNSSYNLSSKNTWQQLARRAISDGNIRWIPVYPNKLGVTDGSFSGFYMWGAVQVEDGASVSSYAGSDVSFSRSSTQSILDLVNGTSITPNTLTYNSDGTFDFVGGADTSWLEIPLSTALSKFSGTACFWIRPSTYNASNGLFVNRNNNTANAVDWLWMGVWDYGNVFYFRLGDGSACCNNDLTISSFSSLCPTATWSHIACSWTTAGTSKIYVNGELKASRSISAIPVTNPSSTGKIGLGHGGDGSFNGKIASTQIYNRQLSDLEVKQNFNAHRNRYGK